VERMAWESENRVIRRSDAPLTNPLLSDFFHERQYLANEERLVAERLLPACGEIRHGMRDMGQ
jgi:hypothetical protein